MTAQGPRRHMAKIDGKLVFQTRPDISLLDDSNSGPFILDAKWKHVNMQDDNPRHGLDQEDLYQLYAYGKRYGCKTVAMVYPRSEYFTTELTYRFCDGLKLICLPFDVANPQRSVSEALCLLKILIAAYVRGVTIILIRWKVTRVLQGT